MVAIAWMGIHGCSGTGAAGVARRRELDEDAKSTTGGNCLLLNSFTIVTAMSLTRAHKHLSRATIAVSKKGKKQAAHDGASGRNKTKIATTGCGCQECNK